MIKKVLFVDDDRILRRMVQKKFEKYASDFSTLTAEDGLDAVKKLKEDNISLVVTDLQMPQMDGFALLVHLSEKYPDIPVIVQTGYGTPKSKKSVLERGAAGYIEKPFKFDQLAERIIITLDKESEGGILHTIPLEMFIQLIEMEQKTCTIRVVDKTSGERGVLFFREGDLMDARIGDLPGKPAAYEIFSWDQVTLSIEDNCAVKEKRIDEELQAILFDAMRLKDEAGEDEASFTEE
jgi:CheY-like chemotaxis protein